MSKTIVYVATHLTITTGMVKWSHYFLFANNKKYINTYMRAFTLLNFLKLRGQNTKRKYFGTC